MKKLIFFFTALYLLSEVTYNLGLVEFLASKNTTIDVYSHLETFGKALSAIGLAIFATRLCKVPLHRAALAVVLAPVLFLAETFSFNYLIDHLPLQARVYGYVEGAYRNAVINGQIVVPHYASLGPREKVELATLIAVPQEQESRTVSSLLSLEISNQSVNELYSVYASISECVFRRT